MENAIEYSVEYCETSTKYDDVFQKTKQQKRKRCEKGEESKNSKEREGSKRARQDLIHSLTPDRPPLAATTMLLIYGHKIRICKYSSLAVC